jgi:hypothetical protein
MYDEQESPEHEIAPELAPLERQLRGMAIAPPRVDRDRLMFAAGQAAPVALNDEPGRDGRAMYDEAGRPRYVAGPSRAGGRVWPAATFTMTAAALLLATMLVWQHRRQSIAQQIVPVQPTVVANDTVHDIDADRPDRLASRNRWQSIPSVNSGYLGVRYVALTRGVGALSELQPSDSDGKAPSDDQANPTTPRGLLKELLPTTHPSNSSHS